MFAKFAFHFFTQETYQGNSVIVLNFSNPETNGGYVLNKTGQMSKGISASTSLAPPMPNKHALVLCLLSEDSTLEDTSLIQTFFIWSPK